MNRLIDELVKNRDLLDEEFKKIIESDVYDEELFKKALGVREENYGREVYIRGLIEISSYCRNDCFYCGIRRSNGEAERYRLSNDEILECCREGYPLGFRTFVLQGGEDPYFTDERICNIVSVIKEEFPDCAVTLSIGEKSRESYRAYYEAGADRYLLRHETAEKEHYRELHPDDMSFEKRRRCLWDLKEIGYQVGSGFMVGSPYQNADNLIRDIRFLQELQPDMIGIGPYITHRNTPFKEFKSGSGELTLRMLAILRIVFPDVLLPATTALGTIDGDGREKGMMAGANVIMPNLSPLSVRKKYDLYDNKLCTGDEAAEYKVNIEKKMKAIGFNIVTDRGDRRKV